MNRIGNNLIHSGENESLVRELVANNVEFILIGGLAMAWYCADRQADDMDLFINPTSENSKRIYNALIKLNMTGFEPNSFTKLGLQVPLKHQYYAELITPRKDGMSYCEVAVDGSDAKLFNIPIKLASLESLIRLKEQAVLNYSEQTKKHLDDLNALKLQLDAVKVI